MRVLLGVVDVRRRRGLRVSRVLIMRMCVGRLVCLGLYLSLWLCRQLGLIGVGIGWLLEGLMYLS